LQNWKTMCTCWKANGLNDYDRTAQEETAAVGRIKKT
jgi:hypothetical protein